MWRDKIREGYHQFSATVEAVEHSIVHWFEGDRSTPLDLNEFTVPVIIKSKNRTITCLNASYRDFFLHCDELPLGKSSDAIVDESSIDLSRQSDALLQQGFLKIQFEYFTTGRNGIRYLVRANKTSLANFSYEPFWILLIAVPTRLDAEDFDLKYDIAKQFLIYKQLEATQKRICILSALGETTRAIAQQLGVSTKTVEKYRQRILDELGLDRTVEIVRLLVRFEERGLLRDFSKVD